MHYIEGFVTPVPTTARQRYVDHVGHCGPAFRSLGVQRLVDWWGDDVPPGRLTDFRRAVAAREDESIVFSWFEHHDRAARDACNTAMAADPRFEALGREMPFDGRRMIFGGFEVIVDRRGEGQGNYLDGIVLAVPQDRRAAYLELATRSAGIFIEYGATCVVEAWGDDVPSGSQTDFRRAVLAEPEEQVVFSWIEWPSKAHRDAGWEKIMADERMKPDPATMPFDPQRMFWGGFERLIEA